MYSQVCSLHSLQHAGLLQADQIIGHLYLTLRLALLLKGEEPLIKVGVAYKHTKGSEELYLLEQKHNLQVFGVISFIRLQNDT